MRYRVFGMMCVLLAALFSQGAMAEAFDPVAATNEYLSSVSAEEEANTDGYVDTGYRIMVISVVFEIVVAFLLLQSGLSRRWRDFAERVVRWKFLQAFIYMPIYLLVTSVIALPLAWYSGYYVEHKFGLSNQDFGQWITEYLKGGAIGIVAFTVFLALFYLIVRLAPRRWWMWGSGLVVSFFAAAMFLFPIFVDPIFNEYKPMEEGPLKERILSIARANGMEADDVKQVDASKQNKRISANVSGLFGTTRIALNDNLLNRVSPDGVEAVMAHEIGHYVLNHQWKTMANSVIIFFVAFGLTAAIFNGIVRRRGAAWGIRDVDDYAGFPLLYAIAMVFFFVATPVFYKQTYVHEAEADIFAINATQNPDAWAEVALLTAEYRKLHPSAREEAWLNHHPSPWARIYMAMVWKAENLPEEPDAVEPDDVGPDDIKPAE